MTSMFSSQFLCLATAMIPDFSGGGERAQPDGVLSVDAAGKKGLAATAGS